MADYNRNFFHHWVPQWLQNILVIIGFLPLMMVNGVYIKNLSFMVSETQLLSSYFMMAYFASSIGMYIVYPLGLRLKQAFHSKKLVIGSLLSLALLSHICSSTNNATLFILCSLLIGVAKFIGLFEFLIPLIQLLCTNTSREKSYPILYPLLMLISYFGSFFYTKIADIFHWNDVYHIMVIILLVETLIMILVMHHKRSMRRFPFYQIDWIGMILFTTILMGINYILCMGEYHDWFKGPIIKELAIGILTLLSIFIYHESKLKRPYLDLNHIKQRNVIASIILSLAVGFFLASGSMLSIYIKSILGYDNNSYAVFYVSMLPGCIIGGLICYHWFRHEWNLKILIMIGVGCSMGSNIIFYFLFSPVGDISNMILPMIMKGVGTIILFVTIGIYCYQDLPPENKFSAGAIFTTIRSFVGVALFITLFNWGFKYLQLQHLSSLASNIDSILWTTRSKSSIYRSIGIQSILLAAKQIYGYTIIIGCSILILISFFRFDKKV